MEGVERQESKITNGIRVPLSVELVLSDQVIALRPSLSPKARATICPIQEALRLSVLAYNQNVCQDHPGL